MKELQEFIEEMRSTSSATDKIAIITRSSAFIHKVLKLHITHTNNTTLQVKRVRKIHIYVKLILDIQVFCLKH